MAANMWRIPASKVVKGGQCSVIQDRGMLRSAPAGSKGDYLFSEVGAGVQPLALIGLWHEVLNWLVVRPKKGIDNRINDLPDIYMGISFYRPGQRFVGLFPVHDAAQQLTEGVIGAFAPGNTITDVGGAIGDVYSLGKTLFGKPKKKKVPTLASNEVYIKFSYLQEQDMINVGQRRASFGDIYPRVLKTLSAMAS